MHPLTQQIVSELDMLYGLYQMAVDLTKRIRAEDEATTQRVLDARQKVLDHTDKASKDLAALLKAFRAEKLIPSNETALVEEKRNLILDVGARIQAVDHQMIRQMQAKMAEIRKELAGQTERKNAVKAYIKAPQPQLLVQ
ncbi:MAG TPA: hypothetical protein VJ385_00210 [Fibrobacteria bacterium]|nr:hypothetical protein [Fibrobacteria bacterium]